MNAAPKKILVIQLRRIGDVILTTPALRALAAAYPQAQIDFLTERPCDEMVRGNPAINELLVYSKKSHLRWVWEIRRRGYDWVIDFFGNPRSMVLAAFSGATLRAGPQGVFWRFGYTHMMTRPAKKEYAAQEKIRMLEPFGVKPDPSDILPQFKADAKLQGEYCGCVKPAQKKPLIIISPQSLKPTRRYFPEQYGATAQILAAKTGADILVIYGPGEKETAQKVVDSSAGAARLAPQFPDLAKLAAFISIADLVITNCNGPKHIAVAVGTPTLTIHNSSDPVSWTPPDNPKHKFIRLETLSCIGCGLNECPRNMECSCDLPPERVAAAALELLRI
jgi:ADP-heptose:LPS heptosyltransferase